MYGIRVAHFNWCTSHAKETTRAEPASSYEEVANALHNGIRVMVINWVFLEESASFINYDKCWTGFVAGHPRDSQGHMLRRLYSIFNGRRERYFKWCMYQMANTTHSLWQNMGWIMDIEALAHDGGAAMGPMVAAMNMENLRNMAIHDRNCWPLGVLRPPLGMHDHEDMRHLREGVSALVRPLTSLQRSHVSRPDCLQELWSRFGHWSVIEVVYAAWAANANPPRTLDDIERYRPSGQLVPRPATLPNWIHDRLPSPLALDQAAPQTRAAHVLDDETARMLNRNYFAIQHRRQGAVIPLIPQKEDIYSAQIEALEVKQEEVDGTGPGGAQPATVHTDTPSEKRKRDEGDAEGDNGGDHGAKRHESG